MYRPALPYDRTEHMAPSGNNYDPRTKDSTYARPTAQVHPERVPNLSGKVTRTCFWWYHGNCLNGERCNHLHALTEPPTNVTPPAGYFHLEDCKLRLCPLRVGDPPEGVTLVKNHGTKGAQNGKNKGGISKRKSRKSHGDGKAQARGNKGNGGVKTEGGSAAARPLLAAVQYLEQMSTTALSLTANSSKDTRKTRETMTADGF